VRVGPTLTVVFKDSATIIARVWGVNDEANIYQAATGSGTR
jgi:hypothetical protein